MSKRNDDPAEISRVGGTEMAWLKGEAEQDSGVEEMLEYRILPRLKIVQAMSATELKEEFGEGSIILSPGNALVVEKKRTVDFVPVFFFPEFLKIADRDDTNNPMILARSFDKAGEIARRARDPNNRFEPYGEKDEYQARFAEVLNFPGFIVSDDHNLKGVACVLGFSRGEFGKGRAFINGIALRKIEGKQVPLWAQRWTLVPGFRERGTRRWWGIDFEQPDLPENLYIQKDQAEFFKGQATEMKDLYDKAKLLVDMSDEKPEEATDVDL